MRTPRPAIPAVWASLLWVPIVSACGTGASPAPTSPHVGRAVARIDPTDWSLHPFIADPLVRPIDVRFHPTDRALYILDFGAFEMDSVRGVKAEPKSGKLWRVPLDLVI